MAMIEYWKNFHRYSISNTGRVISPKGLELHQRINRKGYHMVTLNINGKGIGYFVHRLVAELFCQGKNDIDNCVNHMDENPHNNRSDNLEWCTIWYNNHYGSGEKRRLRQQRQAVRFGKRIELVKDDKRIKFNSMGEASRFLGKDRKYIAHAIRDGRKSVLGWGLVGSSVSI